MQHHLIATTLRFFGELARQRQVRQDGNGERKAKREHRIGSGAVVTEIINDDRESRIAGVGGLPRCRRRGSMRNSTAARGKRRYDVNRVSARAVERAVEADHAAGNGLGDGKIVLARDGVQSLRKCSGLRWIAQRDVDIVSSKSA